MADERVSVSTAVLDPVSGATGLHESRPGHLFVTASIVKADVLATLLLQTQDAGTALTGTQSALATAMIAESDNAATGRLWTEIGGDEGLNAANKRFGLTSTTGGENGYWGLTTTIAADQSVLLRQLLGPASDSLLDSGRRAYVRGLMESVVPGQRWGVSSAADPGTRTALKNGWLPRGSSGLWVVNSIGAVRRGGRTLLLAALSDGHATQADGIARVEAAARATAEALRGSAD
ncbi:serine hydrolase [Phaeacidiphilus oryzae]|uniref:serine hydrolase n=1 Tax=Phaeacidiphilus oryzae TaxID=348818 RepID=UPI00068F8690|nr:serine hydrolase [Phaeacidiphilus oryzae]